MQHDVRDTRRSAAALSLSLPLPLLSENTDCQRVVGAVGRIQGLHLGHEAQEEACYPLLVLWKSTFTYDSGQKTDHLERV